MFEGRCSGHGQFVALLSGGKAAGPLFLELGQVERSPACFSVCPSCTSTSFSRMTCLLLAQAAESHSKCEASSSSLFNQKLVVPSEKGSL